MDVDDFREIALSFRDAEESSHMGQPDFRVGGRIFATLASQELGYGNLMLNPELQQSLISQAPEVFLPIKGGWGRNGMTHIRLSEADERQLKEAIQLAYDLRVQKNNATNPKSKRTKKRSSE